MVYLSMKGCEKNMKNLIIATSILISAVSFSKVNIIIRPRAGAFGTISGYQNSYNRQYAKFLDDCQYYKVSRTWTSGKDTYAQLENGNIQKLKGRHIPYIQIGEFCHIPKEEL